MTGTPGHPAISSRIAWAGAGRPVSQGASGGGKVVGNPLK